MAPRSAQNATLDWKVEQKHGQLSILRAGRTLKVLLQRPRSGNALTQTMVDQITECFQKSATDPLTSRIIITSEGRFFCTGMDLGKASTPVGKGGDSADNEFNRFAKLFEIIQASPKVTIALLNGPCYAGGVGLAFSCDVRLAVCNATATLSEVKLGLCPAIISRYLMREWGVALTREAMLSGRAIPIDELRQIGAVHGVADDVEGLEKLAASYVAGLAKCAPGASTLCKKAVRTHGQSDQTAVLKSIFREMMRPDAESAIGLEDFQAKKTTDWDALGTVASKL